MLFCSQVQGRRTQSGQWQYYWSWEWRRNEQKCGDMGLETRHWSTIVTAETGDIPRNYSSPLPASIRVTAWCGACISNLCQHYDDHPAYPLHSVLGTCLHSFLEVSAHFWLGILTQRLVSTDWHLGTCRGKIFRLVLEILWIALDRAVNKTSRMFSQYILLKACPQS